MKKWIAMLLALCLVLGCGLGCLAEEAAEKTYSELHPEVLAFDSYWVSGDAAVRIPNELPLMALPIVNGTIPHDGNT